MSFEWIGSEAVLLNLNFLFSKAGFLFYYLEREKRKKEIYKYRKESIIAA